MSDKLFKPKLLLRKKIKKVLENIYNYPISIIVASIGYGKTTSVKKFLPKRKDYIYIWVSLISNEIDYTWIWYKICSAISHLDNNISKKLINFGIPKNDSDIENMLNIIEEKLNQKFIFIIDDFNGIKDKFLNKFIEFFAYRNMVYKHIIIISREYPLFNYKKLYLNKYCYIINQQEISFDINETIEFFKLNGFNLDENKKNTLLNYTQGWISAIYLCLLYYYKYNTFDNIDSLNLFMKTIIYNELDTSTQHILMKLSLLDKFTLHQAIFISQNKKAASIIYKIASNNYFIRYDKEDGVYTLHTILKSVAFEALEESDIDIANLYNLCGQWYVQNKNIITAIDYYIKIKHYDSILNLLENFCDDISRLSSDIILNIFDNITSEQKLNYPLTYIFFINYYMININFKKGIDVLYETKLIYENNNIKNKDKILGEINIIEALSSFNNIHKALKHFEIANKLLNATKSRISYNKVIFTFGSPHILYPYHTKEATLAFIVELFEKYIRYYTKIINGLYIGYEYLLKAEYYYEIGELEDSQIFAYKAQLESENQLNLIIGASFILIRLSFFNSKKDNIHFYINELIQYVKNKSDPLINTNLELTISELYACIGEIDKIPTWICKCDLQHCNTLIQNTGKLYFLYAKILCIKENFFQLQTIAETMIEKSYKNNYIFTKIIANIFDSIAKYNLYNIEKAKIPLIEAMKFAKPDNIVMPFIENSKYILPILEYINDEYSNKLLSLCKKFIINTFNETDNRINILTKRETEIIKLVADGYKNIEISEILTIAPVTVEKILSNIYKKLNVKNRVSAVSKIKESSKYKTI